MINSTSFKFCIKRCFDHNCAPLSISHNWIFIPHLYFLSGWIHSHKQCLFIMSWYKSETNQCVFALLFHLLFFSLFLIILFLSKENSNLQILMPSLYWMHNHLNFNIFKKFTFFYFLIWAKNANQQGLSFFFKRAVSKNVGLLETSGFSSSSCSFCVCASIYLLKVKGQ